MEAELYQVPTELQVWVVLLGQRVSLSMVEYGCQESSV
jgi:hypothetical protein